MRISRDDDINKETNSIINQRNYLTDYLSKEKDMEIYDYYSDDGYTGTDFNRPAFTRMFNDIKDGQINTIIVKDLSRLGRNYLHLGKYLEDFSSYNIRLIYFDWINLLNNLIDCIHVFKNKEIEIIFKYDEIFTELSSFI